jgi:hypothetical protein
MDRRGAQPRLLRPGHRGGHGQQAGNRQVGRLLEEKAGISGGQTLIACRIPLATGRPRLLRAYPGRRWVGPARSFPSRVRQALAPMRRHRGGGPSRPGRKIPRQPSTIACRDRLLSSAAASQRGRRGACFTGIGCGSCKRRGSPHKSRPGARYSYACRLKSVAALKLKAPTPVTWISIMSAPVTTASAEEPVFA